jgi:hypothetical protein
MRLLLFVSGVFAAVVCIEKPAEAENGAWCLYQDGNSVLRSAGTQHSNSDWPTDSGATPVDPVRTRHRKDRLH